MGAAIDRTIRTHNGTNSPLCFTSTVVTPSFSVVVDVVPNDATALPAVVVGEICSSLAISAEINDRCTPLLIKILAWDLVLPDTTAVLSRHVGFWRASAHDTHVRNPLVVIVGLLSKAFYFSGVVPLFGESLLQRLVWCFLLHFLHWNLDMLWVCQTVVAQVTFLDNVDLLLAVCYHIAIVSRKIFPTEHILLLSLLTVIVLVLLLDRF